MENYEMVSSEAESLKEKIVIIDHLTDMDPAIKMTDEQIETVHKELERLREQKAQLQTKRR